MFVEVINQLKYDEQIQYLWQILGWCTQGMYKLCNLNFWSLGKSVESNLNWYNYKLSIWKLKKIISQRRFKTMNT